MIGAYVLVQLKAAAPREAIATIRAVAGVKQAHMVAGPADCIAYVEAADPESLAKIVMAIRATGEVASTDTRIAMG
jgi:uncharacterized protein with GYD domain